MSAGSRLDAGVADRLASSRARIADAARRVGRQPTDVTLVAVSKAFPIARVLEAARAGQVDLGESRAQELRDKASEAGPAIRWHFVGRIQRNKVKHIVGVAALIHSIDRDDVAVEVARRAVRSGRPQAVLVQANVGQDPAKAGYGLDGLDEAVARITALDGLSCQGLMTIPPMGSDPRPLFARLRRARDRLRARFPEVRHLSMGMSGDFEVAVEEGATIVRLGEAVFGPRPQSA